MFGKCFKDTYTCSDGRTQVGTINHLLILIIVHSIGCVSILKCSSVECILSFLSGTLTAFGRDTLTDHRWLLGGVPRVSHSSWHTILSMNTEKQLLFMRRIMLLHNLGSKRAGKAASVKLNLSDWNAECDRMCLLGHLLQAMHDTTADDGRPLFDAPLLATLVKRCLDGSRWHDCAKKISQSPVPGPRSRSQVRGPISNQTPARDFNDEANEVLLVKDPAFKVSFMQVWTENLPSATPGSSAEAFSAANEQIAQLNQDARKVAFERDTLIFAKDTASLGKLYEQESKSEKSKRTQRVLHIRQQNVIGASIVSSFMQKSMNFVAGKPYELTAAVDKACLLKRTLTFNLGIV